MSALLPIITSGRRSLTLDGGPAVLPVIRERAAEAEEARRLTALLDRHLPPPREAPPALPADTAAIQQHMGSFYGDPTGDAYLQAQFVADACMRRFWDVIQATDGLRDRTMLLVLPEHGRHLFMNGQNPDSLGRSGVDHGQGDDGDGVGTRMPLGAPPLPEEELG